MILGFKTQINGKPTDFVSKIWESLIPIFSEHKFGIQLFKYPIEYRKCMDNGLLSWYKLKPKIHTIREDKTNRWRAGIMIDFFINVRTKDMFRFAPIIPVVSTQEISIVWEQNTENYKYIGEDYDCKCTIHINGFFYGDAFLQKVKVITSSYTLEPLSQNDGFDTLEEFFSYFNTDFTGKIIHWTDKRY